MNKETLREKLMAICRELSHEDFLSDRKHQEYEVIYKPYIDELMSLISQYESKEQLEVELMEGCFFKRLGTIQETSHGYTYSVGILNRKDDGYGILFWGDTKNDCIDFCNRFNLKIKGEA